MASRNVGCFLRQVKFRQVVFTGSGIPYVNVSLFLPREKFPILSETKKTLVVIFVNFLQRMAPEVLSKSVYTTASDVWSYGITLWEMLSFGQQPWADCSFSQVVTAIT